MALQQLSIQKYKKASTVETTIHRESTHTKISIKKQITESNQTLHQIQVKARIIKSKHNKKYIQTDIIQIIDVEHNHKESNLKKSRNTTRKKVIDVGCDHKESVMDTLTSYKLFSPFCEPISVSVLIPSSSETLVLFFLPILSYFRQITNLRQVFIPKQ